MELNSFNKIDIGLAWCLFCENTRYDAEKMQQTRQDLLGEKEVPTELLPYLEQLQTLQQLPFPKRLEELQAYQKNYPELWSSKIGLVYGGVTKVKQYVFAQTKLPDIRGASALLDRINLVDLQAFFSEYGDYRKSVTISQWLNNSFPNLEAALIPQLIIYSTGGNILAFCPAKFVDNLSDAIERRYTEETLTANSCAVGRKMKLIETRFGLIPDSINANTVWLEKYCENSNNEILKAYFEQPDVTDPEQAFEQVKSFNETVTKLASLFNKRRSGNIITNDRPTRRYPVIFETHPYILRDESDNASAVMIAGELIGEPKLSESLARKRLVGNIAKRSNVDKDWYHYRGFTWPPEDEIYIESWVKKFERYLEKNQLDNEYYGKNRPVSEARSLIEIGNASQPKGFVAYIYADGNNMGGYIQKIKTPQEYQKFSNDVSEAITESVYKALFQHLRPHQLKDIPDKEKERRNDEWIHPFEILTIGGDDVFLIVPADKALAIAKTICEHFEDILKEKHEEGKTAEEKNPYVTNKRYNSQLIHRYHASQTESQLDGGNQCKLSISAGVLITADDTPIYYAEKLTSQLMKSAKKYAKELKKKDYYGGTIDFLVMKAVTMISSNINEFRAQGLTQAGAGEQTLKLYGAPYTLQEIGGILETAKALKDAKFPRSQLYQIRSLLERGKQTAILNYRYFRVRLNEKKSQELLKFQFEEAWCSALTNNGNLAPWMSDPNIVIKNLQLLIFFETFPLERFKLQYVILKLIKPSNYETIWRELVDLYPFTPELPHSQPLVSKEEINSEYRA